MIRWSDIVYALIRFKALSLCVLLLLILNAGLYGFGLVPLHAATSMMEKQLTEARDQRLQDQAVKQARGDLLQFQKRLSDPHDFVRVMSILSKVAKQEGLSVPSLKYNPGNQTDGGLTKMDVALSLNGTYPEIKKFLAFVEEQDRIMVADEITLSTSHDGKQVGADLLIKVYFHEAGS